MLSTDYTTKLLTCKAKGSCTIKSEIVGSTQNGSIAATPQKEPKSGRNPVVHPTARRYGPQKSMSTAAAIAGATTSDCADSGGTMAKVTASETIKPMPTKASRGMRLIVVAIVANFISALYQIRGGCAALRNTGREPQRRHIP